MDSSRLPVPVRDLLDERLREPDVKRLWREMDAKRAAAATPPRARRWAIALASALIGAVVAFFVLRSPSPSVLHLTDGRDIPAHLGAPSVSFDDGSFIR